MSISYVGNPHSVEHDALRDRLAELGVFDEVDALYDAIERGENPMTDCADPRELAERFRLTHG